MDKVDQNNLTDQSDMEANLNCHPPNIDKNNDRFAWCVCKRKGEGGVVRCTSWVISFLKTLSAEGSEITQHSQNSNFSSSCPSPVI